MARDPNPDDAEGPAGPAAELEVPVAAASAAVAVDRRAAASAHLSQLAVLAEADFDRLGDAGRIDALIGLQRAHAWVESLQIEALASIADHDPTPEQWSREEVAAALRLSAVTAAARLADASLIAQHLPLTLSALRDGRLTSAHTRALADVASDLPEVLRGELEQRVLPGAESQTPAQLRQSLRRAALQLDPRAAHERHQAAAADRHVRLTPEPDGMATLSAYLPASDALACSTALKRLARQAQRPAGAEDDRTADQRRADAFVAALLDAGASAGPTAGNPAPRRRPVAEIAIVVGLSTLLGRDQEPAWLEGYGPVTAAAARRLAHEPTGTWRRLIADPADGRLLEYGRTVYKPPVALHDHVLARDGTCTFPTCNITARCSDLDHILPFPEGNTDAVNLHAAHRRHHNAKTHGGWTVSRDDATNTTTWVSPQGRPYPSQPPKRWRPPPALNDQPVNYPPLTPGSEADQ